MSASLSSAMRKPNMEPWELGWVDTRARSTFPRLWSSTTFRILFFSTITWFMCFGYLAKISVRDPTSYFFDKRKGYERSYSLHREKEAYAFLESVNSTDSPPPPASPNPSMCVGVATVKRPVQEQYVRGTIGSLLVGLSEAERAQIHLITFIAHTDPMVHPIYHEPWLRALSDKVLTYDIPKEDLAELHKFEEENLPRNKSMYDYGYLLDNCLKTNAEWITIVEDDVLARAGWYGKAMTSLQKAQAQAGGASWLYLRIFYSESFLGFVSEHWPRYLSASLALFVVLLATLVESRRRSSFLRRHLSNMGIGVLCCCILPAFISLYFMAGYVTMHPPRPGVRLMPDFGCCSQGFIFPQAIVPLVIERTKIAMYEDLYVDMLLERFADAQGLARFSQFPSLLQHIGLKSSKGHGYDGSAGSIFNFEFETF